jgi:hypothetical protein
VPLLLEKTVTPVENYSGHNKIKAGKNRNILLYIYKI